MKNWLFVFFLTQLIILSGGFPLNAASSLQSHKLMGALHFQDDSDQEVIIVQSSRSEKGKETKKAVHSNLTIEEEDVSASEKQGHRQVLLLSIFCSLALGLVAHRNFNCKSDRHFLPENLPSRRYLILQVFRI